MTASATSDFAALAHSMKLATFIGEETGGSYLGNTSNFEFPLILPNTKLFANIPLARYWNYIEAPQQFGRGVFPDYEVVPGIEDILSGRDSQLEFALRLIENNGQSQRMLNGETNK
jgi:hypothetical protein